MTAANAGAGGRALVRLLRAMARAAARVETAQAAEDADAAILVLNGTGPTPDVLHRAPRQVWQKAVSDGLIAQNVSRSEWRITAAGRELVAAREGGSSDRRALAALEMFREPKTNERPSELQQRSLPSLNSAESPLAWLARRKDHSGAPMIAEDQFLAGERLRFEYEQAQLMPRVTIDWQRAAQGGSRRTCGAFGSLELSERAETARQRVNNALSAVGPELANVLVDVCCHLKGLAQLERECGWPQRSAKIILRVALSALARHYAIAPSGDRTSNGLVRVRQWGAEGYRPSVLDDGADGGSVV